jgi:hypothetical protein
MTNLTQNEIETLNLLRREQETGDLGDGFGHVYLDNAVNTKDRSVLGTLASLDKKGYYYQVDGYAWGAVKLEG